MYLRARVWVLVLLALNSAAYAAMADLGGMAAENVRYAALLSTVCVLAVGVCDFLHFRRKHRLLSEICRNARLAAQNLPDCGADALEHDYQALICAMAQDRAEAVSRMDRKMADLSAYYTLWAHQIKTPISAMRLTLHGEGGAQARRLSAQLTRIEQYVDMVLAYQRLESASTDYVFAPIALDDAVRASVRRFAGEFIDRGLKLDFRPGGAQVLTDAKWLGFMLDQLISNALKYTPSGGVTIEMEGETTLAIRDSGIGISPQDLPRIFERGYTGRNGRADQRASGIGLYLCRRIADNLGHALCAESEPGRGTVMRIDFPKRDARHE